MLKVGKHCDFCKQNDFLPFECKKCNKLCCLDHRNTHPCVAEPKNDPVPERPNAPREKKVYKQPLPKPAPKVSAKTPAKQGALEKLRAYMASKPQRSYKGPDRAASEKKKSDATATGAIGDDSIPVGNRYFVQVRRREQQIKDALTGETVIRPEKKVDVFYDKTKPIGYALDRAKKTLGLSSASSFQLNGSNLPSSSPIGGLPPNCILDLV